MKRRFSGGLVVGLLVAIVVSAGCGQKGSPEGTKGPGSGEPSAGATHDQTDVAKQTANKASDKPKDKELSAEQILQRMTAAYKYTKSYADAGRVRLKGQLPGQPVDVQGNFTVAFERPNKIFMNVGVGNLVCNGETMHGSSAVTPDWVLQRPAPAQLDIESLFNDFVLASSMAHSFTKDFSWVPLQVVLLLADDPMKTLMLDVTRTRLLDPKTIDGHECYRVEITRPDGKGVFWIDRQDFALRRFEYPVEMIKMWWGARSDSEWSLVADFTEAQFDGDKGVDPNAFRFEMPNNAQTTSQLLPQDIEMLGKRSKDFYFVGLDNKPVTFNSLADKIVVIDFWSVGDEGSHETLRRLQQLANRFKDNDKIRFLPVNVDPPSVANADIEKLLKDLNVTMPVYRDTEGHAVTAFGIAAPPTTALLSTGGIVQMNCPQMHLLTSPTADEMIESLLAGKDVFPKAQEEYEKMVADYMRLFGEMVRHDLYPSTMRMQEETLRSKIAPKSEPTVMKITPLWTNETVDMPGNLLPVAAQDGTTRIFVSAGKEVVELDSRGQSVGRHDLGLVPDEYVAFLRTAVDRNGRRWFVGSAPGMQQVHLFDEQWKQVMQFPAEMPKDLHAGIGDARIADFDGNGELEIVVGYRGLVGVKQLAMDGREVWTNRSLADVFKMAVGGPGANSERPLFCTNNQCTLVTLDPKGQAVGRVEMAGCLFYTIAAADLDGDGNDELCGLSAGAQGENKAIGLSDGQLAWKRDMPQGLPGPYVDLVAPAWLKPGKAGQWILVGADGSIHVVSADGRLVDQFDYGQTVMGVAFAQLDGKPVLLVASQGKVEALAVSWPD